MSESNFVFLLVPGVFFFVLLFVEIGRRLGTQGRQEGTERERAVVYTVQTAVYALLGLMIAFTFSGAASRFEARRVLTVGEANAIGTVYLRLDLLPSNSQRLLRNKLRRYTEARIEVFRSLPNVTASNSFAAIATSLQTEIWTNAISALQEADPSASILLVPALNDMFDFTVTRAIMLQTHTPTAVLISIFILTLICSLLIGNSLARKHTYVGDLHTVGFALMLTATLFVIVDLDFPRVGLIRLDYVDQALMNTLASMN